MTIRSIINDHIECASVLLLYWFSGHKQFLSIQQLPYDNSQRMI